MSQTVPQKDAIDALRSFNNAIMTSRLYPPAAPQVAGAVEHGYISVTPLHIDLTRHQAIDATKNWLQSI